MEDALSGTQDGGNDVENEDSGNDSDDVRSMLCDDIPEVPSQEGELSIPSQEVPRSTLPLPARMSTVDTPSRTDLVTPSSTSTPSPSQESPVRQISSFRGETRLVRAIPVTFRRQFVMELPDRPPAITAPTPSRIRRPPSPPYLPPLPLRRIQAARDNPQPYLEYESASEDSEMSPSSSSPGPSSNFNHRSYASGSSSTLDASPAERSRLLYRSQEARRSLATVPSASTPTSPIASSSTAHVSSVAYNRHYNDTSSDRRPPSAAYYTDNIQTSRPGSLAVRPPEPSTVFVSHSTRARPPPRSTQYAPVYGREASNEFGSSNALASGSGTRATAPPPPQTIRSLASTSHISQHSSTRPPTGIARTRQADSSASTQSTRGARRSNAPRPTNVHPLNWKALFPDIPYPGSTAPSHTTSQTPASTSTGSRTAATSTSASSSQASRRRRSVYTDSRGTVYPSRGGDYSSDSDG